MLVANRLQSRPKGMRHVLRGLTASAAFSGLMFSYLVFAPLVFLRGAVAQGGDGSQDPRPPVERKGSFEGLEEAGSLRTSDTAKAGESKEAVQDVGAQGKAAATGSAEILELTSASLLREVPSKEAPAIGTPLAAGTLLVRLGPDAYGYVPVGLLEGFEGYVHSKFLRDLGNGWGETAGTNVSFRIRPRVGEPPLCALEHSGTKVAILGSEGDWVKVVAPPVARAWIESGTTKVAATLTCDAKTLDDSRALLRVLGAHPSLAKRLESRLTALEATIAKQKKAAEEAAMRSATKNELEAALTTLASDFDAVRGAEGVTVAALDALAKRATDLKELAVSKGIEDANTQMRIDGLVSGIDRKKILVEAKEILAKPEPGPTADASGTNDSKTGPSEADVATAKRRTWTRVGWIEYRPGSSDYRPYRLMKGGQTIAYLDCPTGRYDLSDFVGREVGLIGELQRADSAELRVLDIERLVILSSMR